MAGMGRAAAVVLSVAAAASAGAAERFGNRFFFFWGDLAKQERYDRFLRLADEASEAGYNGVVLECGAENAFLWDAVKKRRYREALSYCGSRGIEIIPQVWSVGYGSMLRQLPDLVETSLLRGLVYAVHDGHFVFEPERVAVGNSGFEDPGDGIAAEWEVDEPGNVACRDLETRHGGSTSVVFSPAKACSGHRHARIYRSVAVKPYRRYRFSAWWKQERPADDVFESFLGMYARGGGEELGRCATLGEKSDDGGWRRHHVDFYSGTNSTVWIYAGAWEHEGRNPSWIASGRFWIDDVSLETLPLTKVPRGAGAVLAVKNLRTGKLCEEGLDYREPPRMDDWRIRPEDRPVDFEVLPGGSLREGDRVMVAGAIPTQAMIFDKSPYGQYSACMSDPALYEFFARSAAAVEEVLHPRRWILSMDEIRSGGTCRACQRRRTDMAHILGDCLARQYRTIVSVHPGAEVYVWSDMLDPAHNAHDDYYACRGTFEGVWNLIPKELVIVCWWCEKRDVSMPFFERLGFRTLAAAYYDSGNLDGSRRWLETCRRTEHCQGMMYTTWRDNHELLGEFGRMLSK